MDSQLEQDLRHRLGIPADAQHVLVLAESSHWDPDWLFTSDEYYDRWVCRNLDQALDELIRDPRRVYSVECLFFLRKYWDAHPGRQDALRSLVNSRRLRLTSSSVTTADTLTTSTEAILRDFLVGQEWLRANGMTQEPSLAYFPDSFGCSHALPSLLNAAGFSQTALTRVDGMLFVGCDWPLKSQFEWDGSSAALLKKQDRTLDFVWRDSSGGEVLCHWNAFTYGQGDMLAHSGVVRMYLYPLAVPNRSDWNVTRHIHQFVRQLQPYGRTPYLFCPIGFDFVSPISDLVPLLDRYNQRHYPHTGIWVMNAGLDDYLALVNCHRDRLPVVELDPNPYWTGFYTSRPSLKKLAHETVNRLLLAERLAVQVNDRTEQPALEVAWAEAVVSNHHDFITGTANDRVAETEQIPWLKRTLEAADAIITRLDSRTSSRPHTCKLPELPEWTQRDGIVEVHTSCYSLELAEEAGGCIVRAWEPGSRQPLLNGPSNDLINYQDSGGLWRMGHEFIGGTFREVGRSSQGPARLQVHCIEGCLEVESAAEMDGCAFTCLLWFRSDTPVIRCQARGRAAERRTVTARFDTGIVTHVMTMDEPGGVIIRPVEEKYVPTFWPMQSFVHVREGEQGRGIAVLTGMPGAVAYRPDGSLELITHRNALHETAFGFVTFPGQPAIGHERSDHTADYGIVFTPAGNWLQNNLLQMAQCAMTYPPEHMTTRARLQNLAVSIVETDPSNIVITTIKPATRGEGIIVRLLAPGQTGLPVTLNCTNHNVTAAWLCDARERDIQSLDVHDNQIHLAMPGSIATVRIHYREVGQT